MEDKLEKNMSLTFLAVYLRDIVLSFLGCISSPLGLASHDPQSRHRK